MFILSQIFNPTYIDAGGYEQLALVASSDFSFIV